MRESQRTGITGSALVGLLARYTETEIPGTTSGFADRLGRWLGWTDAIGLAGVLEHGPGAVPSEHEDGGTAVSVFEKDCARARSALGLTTSQVTQVHGSLALAEEDLPALRRRHLAAQQAMENTITPLRGRLRDALGARSPALAQLAAVDAVMESALAPRERQLLAAIPAMMERHAERVRRTLPAARPAGWLETFARDVHAVLLAELDLRMQPIEGLMDALRTSPTTR